MFTVVITEKGGEQRRLDFDKPEVTIGRVQGNDIILPKGNVSKRHSRIVLKDGKFIIVDLKSTNGTYVNGRKITSPLVIKGSDKIYIGDFIMSVEEVSSVPSVPAHQATPQPEPSARRPPPPLPKKKPMPFSGGDPDEMGLPLPDRTAGAVRPPTGPLGPARRGDPLAGRRPPVRDTLGADLAEEPLPGPAGLSDMIAGGGVAITQPQPLLDPPAAAPLSPAPAPLPVTAPSMPSQSYQPPAREPVAPIPSREPVAPVPVPAPRRAPPQAAAPADPKRQKTIELKREIHDRLGEYLDLQRLDVDRLADEELWEKTDNAICDIVESLDGEGAIPAFVEHEALIKDVLHEALGLGPLEEFLADEAVSEIMVSQADRIFVARRGVIEPTNASFSSDKILTGVIDRIIAPLGRRIGENAPIVDVRMKDGSRINAVVPPLALRGPALTIQKLRHEMLSGEGLVQLSTCSQAMIAFLQLCVAARQNILICGGPGAGTTTTLNVVGNLIPDEERVVSIEEVGELQLKLPHWIQLESRPAGIDGTNAVTVRDLLRHALRMRPGRILFGDCRGAEVQDLLLAMNAGHDGSIAVVHAGSAREALGRLAGIMRLAGGDLPATAVREQIAAALGIVVYQARFLDGKRRITSISEVVGLEGDSIALREIFVFKQEGTGDQRGIRGRHVASGVVPRFCEEFQQRGGQVNEDLFH